MVCARVVGNDQTIQLCTRQAQLELQQFTPGVARAIIESLEQLTPSLAIFTDYCVQGIKANKKHITELLDGSFVYATDYTEDLGYAVVAEAVVAALKSGKSLKEILATKKRK
jgi:aspartate ammonia-lyase